MAPHELLMTDVGAHPEQVGPGYAAAVGEALALGWEVLLDASSALVEEVEAAVGGRTAQLHVVGPRAGVRSGARPAAVLEDLSVLTDLHAGGGARVQSVRQAPVWADTAWWDWSRVEAAFSVVVPSVWHVCGYDRADLDAARLADLLATHPRVREHGVSRPCPSYVDAAAFLHRRTRETAPVETLEDRPADLEIAVDGAASAEEGVRARLRHAGVGADVTDDLAHAVAAATADVLAATRLPARVGLWVDTTGCRAVVADQGPRPEQGRDGSGALVGLVPGADGTAMFQAHCAADARHVTWAGRRAVRLCAAR